ncbi:hypothetical protein ACHAXS_002137 [Conticribra weissflogii]
MGLVGARKIKLEGTIDDKRFRTHTNDEGEMEDHDERENHSLGSERKSGPPSEDYCQMEANQDNDSYEKCCNRLSLQWSISVIFTHFSSSIVQEDSRLHARMTDDEIRRLWLSQDENIEAPVDYRVGHEIGEGVRHCQPCSTELDSLAKTDPSADFIGLCFEVLPQVRTSCSETSMASFSLQANEHLCQTTYDSSLKMQPPTMCTVCFENPLL